MPTSCTFLFDHPNSVYYSGEVLNGKIILQTQNVKSVRGVYITIKGIGKVQWSEEKSRHDSQTNRTEYYTVHYYGEQIYLNSRTLVVGEIDLPPGTHEYTFNTQLPPQIPSTISGEYGNVSYEVELKLDRPFRPDNVYINTFTVIQLLNLNLDPSYSQSVVDTEQKFFCCCCCESGPMNAELRTEFAGYIPGQNINFSLLIDNESNKDIDGCSVNLMQRVGFESLTPEHQIKSIEHVLGNVRFGGANRFSKKLYQGAILVPQERSAPTTLSSTDLIKVSYYLKAEIDSGFCSLNVLLRAPVTIGTVPLVVSATNPNNVITVQPTAPTFDLNGATKDQPPEYSSTVPPSFEEATKSKVFDRNLNFFLPKYPVNNNCASPSDVNEKTYLLKESPPSSRLPAPRPSARPRAPPDTTQSTVDPSAPPETPDPMETLQPSGLPYPLDAFGGMPIPGPSAPPSSVNNDEAPNLGWRKFS